MTLLALRACSCKFPVAVATHYQPFNGLNDTDLFLSSQKSNTCVSG